MLLVLERSLIYFFSLAERKARVLRASQAFFLAKVASLTLLLASSPSRAAALEKATILATEIRTMAEFLSRERRSGRSRG